MAASDYSDKKALAAEEKDIQFACTSVNSTQESFSEGKSAKKHERVKTWGNDSVHEATCSPRGWPSKPRWKVRWTWMFHDACLGIWHATKWTARTIKNAPLWKHFRWSKKQFYAFLILFVSVILPIFAMGTVTPVRYMFRDKTMGCGNTIGGDPQNATVRGIENLFALDATWGQFTFSQAKTIDILWDLLIGKGAQALAWWATYNVFCDALLRAIERHPASFSIFQRMAMEGPGLHCLWELTKELWTAKSIRTRFLFFYMFWSTGYVLLVPIVLGAMTGYDSTSIAWLDIDGSNNIIPASQLQDSWVIIGTKNETWKQPGCADRNLHSSFSYIMDHRRQACDCKFPNGTIVTAAYQTDLYYHNSYVRYDDLFLNCTFDFPNNTQTWTEQDTYTDKTISHFCNTSISVPVSGKTYNADDLVTNYGYCYNGIGYEYDALMGRSRCLPDTANPTYQWGFATLMSGLFMLVTSGWVFSMYVLWQDAQFNSTLVKEGYRLTPLRAAFAMAVAARRRTGLSGKDLISAKNRALGRQLYGKKGTRGTVVDHGLFLQDLEDTETDTDGAVKSPITPMSPTPLPLARSNTDISVHVLSDEELRKRYLRGVEEARLSRKPLSREATLVGEGLWERNHELPGYEGRSQGHDASASGEGSRDDEGGENKNGADEQSKRKDEKVGEWRNRLQKVRRPG
ncbi:hypothetical protein BKA58DRAFT_363494 [Alternaria rosae]|uniref:uncharacterized protein n=1 Tax=Alternaria rosae TaxID=1187941 RepID=UPI001E8E4B82|nr:uncharacterized protein BKA58DRAFT_371209 [Alternaria rosae]XP_046019894.1 uncharacterized protein BKA58DRAFT_371120 [Alternaria rosae]XP_046022943.1 uncharacterized protein BKA58DRAFT_363494 [Alternaria rosae]KAH6844475.1 hypothetical protein BKA58DRAFT_371209 [Alternaria rosae]KAH6848508.1 hypothetical protein BKA58DRAFT_371120 [Alternaria rosae]KAH6866291.1 hypothetical protein BKA58DRAFT_363494 [Alternaria rosae]